MICWYSCLHPLLSNLLVLTHNWYLVFAKEKDSRSPPWAPISYSCLFWCVAWGWLKLENSKAEGITLPFLNLICTPDYPEAMFPPRDFFPDLVFAVVFKKLSVYFSKESSLQQWLKKSGVNPIFYLAPRFQMDQINFIWILWKTECWEISPEIMFKNWGENVFLRQVPTSRYCFVEVEWNLGLSFSDFILFICSDLHTTHLSYVCSHTPDLIPFLKSFLGREGGTS